MKAKMILRSQSGTVLVIALMMIVVLTLIALSATNTSIFEWRLSGDKRSSTAAFYAAESGVQSAMADITNFTVSEKYVNNNFQPFPNGAKPNPADAKVVIEYDPSQKGSPRGSGMSAINFEFDHFMVQSKGEDDLIPGSPKSTCTVEEKVVRMTPTLQGGY